MNYTITMQIKDDVVLCRDFSSSEEAVTAVVSLISKSYKENYIKRSPYANTLTNSLQNRLDILGTIDIWDLQRHIKVRKYYD